MIAIAELVNIRQVFQYFEGQKSSVYQVFDFFFTIYNSVETNNKCYNYTCSLRYTRIKLIFRDKLGLVLGLGRQ